MATIIDALVVELGFDPRKWLLGTKQTEDSLKKTSDAADKAGKIIEDRGKKAAEFFAGVRREVTALFTAFVGGAGLTQFIFGTAKMNTEVSYLADNLNMSRQELWAWQQAMGAVGASAEEANAALRNLQGFRGLAHADPTGFLSQHAGAMTRFGITMADVEGDPTQYIMKVVKRLQNDRELRGRRDLQQYYAQQYFGITAGMFNMANLPNATQLLQKYMSQAPSDADDARAKQFTITWNNLKATLKAAASTVASQLLGPLQKLTAFVTDLAQHHLPLLKGAIMGLTAAVAILGVALLPIDPVIFAIAGGVALLGAAIGAVVDWFHEGGNAANLFGDKTGKTSAAVREFMNALRELWGSYKGLASALYDDLTKLFGLVTKLFGTNTQQVVATFFNLMTNAVHALSDAVRVVTALLRGDLKGAWSAAKDFNKDMAGDATKGVARGSREDAGKTYTITPGSPEDTALGIIRRNEGFRGQAYWDRNHYRAGYGSDTKTDARTGEVTSVVQGTTVSRADAEADLKRRVGQFAVRTATAIGPAWNKLTGATQAMLIDLAYNYGSITRNVLKDVLSAAKRGDDRAVALAIQARAGDNNRVNAKRRAREANTILAALPTAPPAQGPSAAKIPGLPAAGAAATAQITQTNSVAHNDNSQTSTSEVQINGGVHVHTQATDAQGIAGGINQQLRRQLYVDTANTGIS